MVVGFFMSNFEQRLRRAVNRTVGNNDNSTNAAQAQFVFKGPVFFLADPFKKNIAIRVKAKISVPI